MTELCKCAINGITSDEINIEYCLDDRGMEGYRGVCPCGMSVGYTSSAHLIVPLQNRLVRSCLKRASEASQP